MIDNVVLIVTGTLHERDVHELLEKCHPLGMFDRLNCCLFVFSEYDYKYYIPLILFFIFQILVLPPSQWHKTCVNFTD